MFGVYDGNEIIAKFSTPLTVKSIKPVYASDTLNLKRVIGRKGSAQRWEIEARLEPTVHSAGKLFAFFAGNGYTETIQISMPQPYSAIEYLKGYPALTASGSVGDSELIVTGVQQPDKILGCFIRFENHSKIYIIRAATANSLKIFPNLTKDVSGQILYLNNFIVGNFYLDLDSLTGMSYTDGIMMDMGVMKFVEAL
jgi:hypothetical protein